MGGGSAAAHPSKEVITEMLELVDFSCGVVLDRSKPVSVISV
tara:strand:+ start:4681 stop:4806 length:126 start_codon:yes stop_codon:yes gene_type:complete